MLVFNRDKEKKIKFSVDLEGIDSSMLEYYIRLSSDNTDYGFKGTEKNGVLEFTIPALGDIIKESEILKLNSIKIEVHDRENKYYLKPFDDSIKVEEAPKAVTEIKDQEDKKKEVKIVLEKTVELDGDLPAPKSKSKISKFLK